MKQARPDERSCLDVEEVARADHERPRLVELGTGGLHRQIVVGGYSGRPSKVSMAMRHSSGTGIGHSSV